MKRKLDENIIYEAALKNFARYGYRKTSLDDIASELEMTKGNLYRYSNNKQSLYQECIRYALYQWLEHVRAAVADVADHEQKLITMCETALVYLKGNSPLMEMLSKDDKIMSPMIQSDIYIDVYEDSRIMIAEIISGGVEEGVFREELKVEEISEIIYTIYQVFLMMAYRQGKSRYVSDFYASTIQLLLNGIKTK